MSTTARTILGEAEKLGVEVIVMGSRGLTGLKSLLLGTARMSSLSTLIARS